MFAATKFAAPPARPQHIVRDDLLERTAGLLGGRHLFVSAPAGAGKSTFAAQWAAGCEHSAWVSLVDADDEPGRFWTAFIMAIGTVAPGVGMGELGPLLAGGDVHGIIVRLVDELATAGIELALVVDDLHLIDDQQCLDGLAWMIQHAPRGVRIGVCTRRHPRPVFARLIAHGDIVVINGSDLLLDRAATEEFLGERLGLELSEGTVDEVLAHTEGWAAGLYLAALSLRAGASTDQLPAGGDRRMRSYLAAEVLESIEHDQLDFLECACVFERFSAELCDHVLERTDSAALIDRLQGWNLFIVPLGGGWFRLHALFAELLRERTAARGDADLLHARAAGWYLKHNEISEAIDELIRAGQHVAAGELIATYHARFMNLSRRGAAVTQWLDQLPAVVVRATPALCLTRAWVAGLNGVLDETEAWLVRAAALPQHGPLPDGCATVEAESELIRAAFGYADFTAVIARARRSIAADRPESAWWPVSWFVAGLCEYLRDGPTESAFEALVTSEQTGAEHAVVAASAPALLGAIHAERGEAAAAAAAVERAASARSAYGVERVPQAAIAWWATSRTRLLLGDVPGAAADAEAGMAAVSEISAEHDSTMVVPPSLIALARARVAQGRRAEAVELLADARRRLAHSPDPGRYLEWLEEVSRDARPQAVAGVDALSEREHGVLALLAGGRSLNEIAGDLYVSVNTLKTHCKAIYRKLGVGSRQAAVARGRELGLIPEDHPGG